MLLAHLAIALANVPLDADSYTGAGSANDVYREDQNF